MFTVLVFHICYVVVYWLYYWCTAFPYIRKLEILPISSFRPFRAAPCFCDISELPLFSNRARIFFSCKLDKRRQASYCGGMTTFLKGHSGPQYWREVRHKWKYTAYVFSFFSLSLFSCVSASFNWRQFCFVHYRSESLINTLDSTSCVYTVKAW